MFEQLEKHLFLIAGAEYRIMSVAPQLQVCLAITRFSTVLFYVLILF